MHGSEECFSIVDALTKRKDASWFNEPVPEDTPGYSDVVSTPMDYGTIGSKLSAGAYATATAFAADVRLVAANAIAYSPELDNECHIAAKTHLAAFEKALLKAGLATDGGAAATAAAAAASNCGLRHSSRLQSTEAAAGGSQGGSCSSSSSSSSDTGSVRGHAQEDTGRGKAEEKKGCRGGVQKSRAWSGICRRTEGCVRNAGHVGRCKVADIAEVEYEVEEIFDEMTAAGGKIFYLVKWVGWPSEDNTWEPESSLDGCPAILQRWKDARQSE